MSETDIRERIAALRPWPEGERLIMALEQLADGVYIGPIEHSNSLCQKTGCTCWCQACERHNWRHARDETTPPRQRDPLSPQWEDCKVCGGDHWTKDHPAEAPHG